MVCSPRQSVIILLSNLLIWSVAAAQEAQNKPSPAREAGLRLFETRIRPLLADHCYECHGPDSGTGEADLRVDSLEGLLRGGKSGPAIVLGEPERSLMILAVRHDGAVAMPPKKKLSQHEIDSLSAWVKERAPWPGSASVAAVDTPASGTPQWTEAARNFWAFQPIRAGEPPAVRDPLWSQHPIDRFILARLEAAGLKPAQPADKTTLLRRVTFDLSGLPPTAADRQAFLNDQSPEAFERVINRLLESPAYGERWGRHWLDVARYADSNGMDDNLAYSDAWRYRDYVIAAFNSDKPFDRFVKEQLAGDLLAQSDPALRDELITATSFLAIGPKMLAEDDPIKQQLDIVDEQLDTTCRVFLALTMGCVRCHDHKFDPLSMSDYYGLAGIFNSTKTMNSFRVDSKWNTTALGGAESGFRLEDLEQIIDRHDNALVNGNTNQMSSDERQAHANLLDKALKEYASIAKAMAVTEGIVADLELRLRGNHVTRGPVVPRRFPTIIDHIPATEISKSTSGRLEFARWMTDPRNPLPARVIVNRVWRWHFGQGLVGSVDNFGKLGELPSHPELLDWLAHQFMADGWSLKKLHRRILLSQTWQMDSSDNEQAMLADPTNRLRWQMPRRRFEAEEVRDALLFVSGQLDQTMGGTLLSSQPFQNLSLGGLSRKPDLYQSVRRSVYLPVMRGAVYDQFQAFDFPDPAVLNGNRTTTTIATQALFMLNSPLVQQAAVKLSQSLLDRSELTDEQRLESLGQRLFSRRADAADLSSWQTFLKRYETASLNGSITLEKSRQRAWEGLCRALLSSNDFLYVD